MQTFYFYDTETSGTSSSGSRIMQFAGIRTDEKLNPLGDPDDILIQLPNDILPDPDAVLIHGLTPQQVNADGITEAEFCQYFQQNIATPNTIFIGFNNIRFDDEFIRYTMYRNFYEPYEWHYKDGRSRFDLMDMLRMMRALRPEGISWPFSDDGKPTVRLEAMTAANGLDHQNAHTALADVKATVEVAKLVKKNQPKLFDYLLKMRSKEEVEKLVESSDLFIYTSGKYSNEFLKTTIAAMLYKNPNRAASLVYDLRYDPTPYLAMTPAEIADLWNKKYEPGGDRLPVKSLQYNRCPAVAPIAVLDAGSQKRIGLTVKNAKNNLIKLQKHPEFAQNVAKALGIMDTDQASMSLGYENDDVDKMLYSSFWNQQEKYALKMVREHPPAQLGELTNKINNKRMLKLLPLYKARNYSQFLSPEERDAWEVYRQEKLLMGKNGSKFASFANRLNQLLSQRSSARDHYLLTELQLYAESIMPDIN